MDPHAAAELLHMGGRAYCAFFDKVELGARFEITVQPGVDAWVASLWKGCERAGSDCRSESLEEVKYEALRKLYLTAEGRSERLRSLAQQQWEEIRLRDLS